MTSEKQNGESNSGKELVCKLTIPELQERKAMVIAKLKHAVTAEKELKNGYAYKFQGSDQMIDDLVTFIKSERQCCEFFTFNLRVESDKDFVWLEVTGPVGAKYFIKTEMEL